jgi:hypothetical protein
MNISLLGNGWSKFLLEPEKRTMTTDLFHLSCIVFQLLGVDLIEPLVAGVSAGLEPPI